MENKILNQLFMDKVQSEEFNQILLVDVEHTKLQEEARAMHQKILESEATKENIDDLEEAYMNLYFRKMELLYVAGFWDAIDLLSGDRI